MDYPRFLIATPLLKEINVFEEVWIDGQMIPIRIIEDVDFGFVEDACLFECEDDNNSKHSVPECLKEDEPIVDALVQQIHDDCVLKPYEDKEVRSDTINQHPTMHRSDTVQVVEKENSTSPDGKTMTNCIEEKAMVKPCNVPNKSQQVSIRSKVAPSLTVLKRLQGYPQQIEMN